MVSKVDYKKPPAAYVIGCYRDFIPKAVYVLELYYGQGLSPKVIISYGVSKTTFYRILKLYKPKKGDRDITMTIMSKV